VLVENIGIETNFDKRNVGDAQGNDEGEVGHE